MGKGRTRKQGKRTKSGRLSRAGVTAFDHGTERAQAMMALYGHDGCDAIGRAWRSGLLGEDASAKAMLDTARQISNIYWSAYATGRITCTLGDRTFGSVADICPDKARQREEWMTGALDSVKRLGWPQRRFFDQLCIDVNPDHGPAWLDRLCFAHRAPRSAIRPEDASALQLALEGLALIADVDMPRVVRLKAA